MRMKKLVTALLFISLISLSGNSQDKKKLLEIKYSSSDIIDRLQEYNIPVYHITEQFIFTGASLADMRKLEELDLDYRVLDENFSPANYYIVSAKPGRGLTQGKFSNYNILSTTENSFLIKADAIDYFSLKNDGYDIITLPDKPILINKVRNMYIASPLDSLINYIIDGINPDSIRMFIQSLQDFGTRYALANNRDSVSSWIYHQFKRMGYEVEYDTFYYAGMIHRNVVATLYGSVNPTQVYVIGGHHDSYSNVNPMVTAPGADDNASGTSAALEIARVFKQKNYIPEKTIKFITFATEELGLIGSNNYALKAMQKGLNICLMFNHDMIGYLNPNQSDRDFFINQYTGSEYYAIVMNQLAKKFTTLNPVKGSTNSSSSDSYSFWRYGFPSVYLAERDFSPVYHTPNDLITLLNMDYIVEILKVTTSTFLTLSVIPSEVQNIFVYDFGTGSELYLTWNESIDTDLSGYKVYVGKSSGLYDTSYFTQTNSFVLTNLESGVKYYIGVTAVDNNGYESFVKEITGTPLIIPRIPKNLKANALWHEVFLYWEPNGELDLLGYNIYRSNNPDSGFTKINNMIENDPFFYDNNNVTDAYLYYKITAVDQDLNESDFSDVVRSRGVSLAHGILVVDETYDSSGIPLHPTDSQVDEFFDSLLYGFKFQQYDIAKEKSLSLADLGAYSTIIWHGNDFKDFSAPQNYQFVISQYLNYGGNLLITSYSPTKAFGKNYTYPKNFSAGDFIYEYLKIRRVENKPLTRMIGAKSIVDYYPSLYVDTTKTDAIFNYHLINIEAIYANDQANETFIYDTNYDSTILLGSLKGKPVAVEYYGWDFKTVVLGFPLYFMNFDSARAVVRHILINKFNEPLSVSDELRVPEELFLSHAYPNPFNMQTIIRYGLKEKSKVNLKIYNLLGQEVNTLIDQEQSPGYYEVKWDGRNSNNMMVTSGVYIYRLTSNGKSISRKVVLLK